MTHEANGHTASLVGPRRGRRPALAHPQRDRAYARPAILAAARTLFKNESYGTISVERIAAFAQVTRHTLTNHFSSKDEIFKLSRESLIAEVSDRIAPDISVKGPTQEGILFFLENCFSVFSCDENLEIMTSIKRDGRFHPWLADAHQRHIRGRLIQSCETFLLYHADRNGEVFGDIRLLAEQLTSLAEQMVYGPYGNCKGKGVCPPALRARNFLLTARMVGAVLGVSTPDQVGSTPISIAHARTSR